MERIGLAASKMAKGNIWLYNGYVILISFLFSFFIYVLAGATVLFAIVIMAYVDSEVAVVELQSDWTMVLNICMVTLTVIMILFNLLAISKNLKLPRK